MKAVLSRSYSPTETKGLFLVLDGSKLVTKCVTIELPDNGNQHNTSCIPEGTYTVVRTKRPNGDSAFQVLSVKDRSNILIHIGNYANNKPHPDTLGCILPGMGYSDINSDGFIDVYDSAVAMQKLLTALPNKFQLHII